MNTIYAPLIDVALEIKLAATAAHLWFEEVLSGDTSVDHRNIWQHSKEAEWYLRAMLVGDKNFKGTFAPLTDTKLRQQIEDVQSKLEKLEVITLHRLTTENATGPHNEWDQEYDNLFRALIDQVDQVETGLHQLMAQSLNRFQITQVILIVACILLAFFTAISFQRFERQRTEYFISLQKANESLEEEMVEHKKAKESLLENERRLNDAQWVAKVANWERDFETGKVYWSDEQYRLFGYEPHEVPNSHELFRKHIHPDDIDMVAKTIEESLASGNPFVIDCRYVPKNGKVRYANIICRVELDDIGKPRWMHGTFQDITERKAAEEATRKANAELEHEVQKRTFELVQTNEPLKHEIGERRQAEQELLAYQAKPRTLSSELSLTEERERRRIATEQHDRIGQTLAFTKIKLGELQKASPSKSAAKVVEEIRQFIEQTIQDTRSLTFELSPPVLYDLGLEAAVEGFTNKVKKQYGLAIEFYDDELPKPLNEGVRVFIYQAIRELLFNITRHAKAVSAKVSIRREGENIVVDIGDDGVGFDKHFQNCM